MGPYFHMFLVCSSLLCVSFNLDFVHIFATRYLVISFQILEGQYVNQIYIHCRLYLV